MTSIVFRLPFELLHLNEPPIRLTLFEAFFCSA